MRWLVRVALLGAALTLVISALVEPVTARAEFNQDFYNFCVKDLGQSVAYCCAHAEGVMRDGDCKPS
jgi:hypothetical protein